MPKPKISLIIPAYNEEKYLPECLLAAIQKSNGRFHEIIVIDNASTDKTSDVAKQYEGVKVIREDKKGLTKARQRGLEEATGDILAFIDADTILPDYWFNVVEKEFMLNDNLASISGPYYYYDIPLHKKIGVKLYWYFLAVPTYWITGYMIVGGNFAIKKIVLEKMGGFDTSIAFYGEDTNIARRAKKHGRVKFTLDLMMPTSGRRLQNQGLSKTALLYMANFLSEVLRKKPATSTYQDFR